MTLSASRWIAQALAEALYRHHWTTLRTIVYGEPPNFRTVGANQTPPAALLNTRCKPLPKAHIPECRIKLGWNEYQHTLSNLTPNQHTAWFAWLEPTFDKHGKLKDRTALFQARGAYVQTGTSDPDAQTAALLIASRAAIEPTRFVTDTPLARNGCAPA